MVQYIDIELFSKYMHINDTADEHSKIGYVDSVLRVAKVPSNSNDACHKRCKCEGSPLCVKLIMTNDDSLQTLVRREHRAAAYCG
jgi:hypothetical protein